MKKITLLFLLLAIPLIGFSQNIVIDPTFADVTSVTDAWTNNNGVTDTGYDDTVTHTEDGTGSYKLITRTNAVDLYDTFLKPNTGSSGTSGLYRISFWVKGEAGVNIRPFIFSGSQINGVTNILQDSEWTFISQTIEIPNNSNKSPRLALITPNKTINIDDVSLERISPLFKNSYFFDTNDEFEEWTINSAANASIFTVIDGGLELVAAVTDDKNPSIIQNTYKVDASKNQYIHIKYKNTSTLNKQIRLQYKKDDETGNTGKNININSEMSSFEVITLDMVALKEGLWGSNGYETIGNMQLLYRQSGTISTASSDGKLTIDAIIFSNNASLEYIWTGITDTDWAVDTNWLNGTSPGLTPISDITIPGGLANYPVIPAATTLTISTGINLTIAPNAIITNNGTISNTGGNITFQSDITGSAYIGEGTGSFSGDFTIERYIPENRAFRLLSTSVTTDDFIANNWQEDTYITGSNSGADGFDWSSTGTPSMFTFNNDFNGPDQKDGWNSISNTVATNLTTGTPYLILVRGDRSETLVNTLAKETTLRSTGTLNAENSQPDFIDLNETSGYFSLVGNPFQAPIDMKKQLANLTNSKNVNRTYYWIWDPTMGSYATIDVTTNLASIGNGNKYLQVGQGAFIQTDLAEAASIRFKQAFKNTLFTETTTFKASISKSSSSKLRLSIYETSTFFENGVAKDGLLIQFDNSYNNEVDAMDASKFINPDENFATSNGGELLSIEKRNTPTASDEIALNITKYRNTDYTIVATGTSLSGETAFLFDAYTNDYTEIPQNGSVNYAYSINTNIPASTAADRFSITFTSQSLSVDDLEMSKIHVYPNPVSSGQFYINIPQDMDDLEVSIYNILGAKLYSKSGFKAGSKETINTSFTQDQGMYFIQLTSNGATATKKIIIN